MLKKIKSLIMGFAFAFLVASPVLAAVSPIVPVASASCDARFLGLPAWYRGLAEGDDCSKLVSPADVEGEIGGYITMIVLNIVEAGLFIVGYVAVYFILYGGFQFIVGGSNPDKVAKARKSILNASIGLLISMASIGLVNFVFSFVLTGSAG